MRCYDISINGTIMHCYDVSIKLPYWVELMIFLLIFTFVNLASRANTTVLKQNGILPDKPPVSSSISVEQPSNDVSTIG